MTVLDRVQVPLLRCSLTGVRAAALAAGIGCGPLGRMTMSDFDLEVLGALDEHLGPAVEEVQATVLAELFGAPVRRSEPGLDGEVLHAQTPCGPRSFLPLRLQVFAAPGAWPEGAVVGFPVASPFRPTLLDWRWPDGGIPSRPGMGAWVLDQEGRDLAGRAARALTAACPALGELTLDTVHLPS